MQAVPTNLSDRVSLTFVSAAIIGVLTVVVPLIAFLNYRGLFGASAEAKLYVLCALGTAASAAVLAGRRWRSAGLVSGLVGGVCGTAVFLYATGLYPRADDPTAPKGWLVLVFIAGAQAGVMLFWLLARLKSRENQ
jgi:hypothetical protein